MARTLSGGGWRLIIDKPGRLVKAGPPQDLGTCHSAGRGHRPAACTSLTLWKDKPNNRPKQAGFQARTGEGRWTVTGMRRQFGRAGRIPGREDRAASGERAHSRARGHRSGAVPRMRAADPNRPEAPTYASAMTAMDIFMPFGRIGSLAP